MNPHRRTRPHPTLARLLPGSCLALLGLVFPAPGRGPDGLAAQSPEARGTALVREMDRRARGYGDFQARLRMEIHDGNGDPRVRTMTVQTMESDDGDRTLVVLERPADLAGTAFLSIRQAGGDRAQWIYLPSRRRARRIGGSRSSDAFLGSHFTHGDLDPPTLDGYRFRWIRDEEVAGRPGAVVERTPAEHPDGPWELLWIDTLDHLLHRVEYRDASGAPDRTLILSGYETVDGFPRPTAMEMRAADGTGRTVLRWEGIRIGVGLTERDFDPQRLGR